jgi:hypothetical protein
LYHFGDLGAGSLTTAPAMSASSIPKYPIMDSLAYIRNEKNVSIKSVNVIKKPKINATLVSGSVEGALEEIMLAWH